eukprot:TRINITY_DN1516_c0_g1_i2.p1 TRINITY_DN1516_c0_g1~~TRINITY_DN1516_c0_g1_i2.p1  ORF type:complete len:153 (-),score=32.48 TRINITY_DN1516_c0_g1_i2:101-559(-)
MFLTSFSRLEKIDLSYNKLTTIAPELLRALSPSLTELLLDHNLIQELAPEIGECQNLKRLTLNSNQLSSLPTELGLLTSLKVLQCGQNPLSFPPPSVVEQGTPSIIAFLREQKMPNRNDPTIRAALLHLAVMQGILPEDFEINFTKKKTRPV